MKVILVKDVDKLGKAGDLVVVKEGYARNYLIPKNMAKEATVGNVKSIREALTIAWSQQSPVLGISCNYFGRVCEAESVFLSWECGTVHQYSVANSMCSKWSESVRLITWPCQNNPEPNHHSLVIQRSCTRAIYRLLERLSSSASSVVLAACIVAEAFLIFC